MSVCQLSYVGGKCVAFFGIFRKSKCSRRTRRTESNCGRNSNCALDSIAVGVSGGSRDLNEVCGIGQIKRNRAYNVDFFGCRVVGKPAAIVDDVAGTFCTTAALKRVGVVSTVFFCFNRLAGVNTVGIVRVIFPGEASVD